MKIWYIFSKLNVFISYFPLRYYSFTAGPPWTPFQTYFKEFEIFIIFHFQNLFLTSTNASSATERHTWLKIKILNRWIVFLILKNHFLSIATSYLFVGDSFKTVPSLCFCARNLKKFPIQKIHFRVKKAFFAQNEKF